MEENRPRGRRRRRLTSSDMAVAVSYLEKKRVLGELSLTEAAWRLFDNAKENLDNLNAWCESFLDHENWRRLVDNLRQFRHRKSHHKYHVVLEKNAFERLHAAAKRDGITISEIIEKYVK